MPGIAAIVVTWNRKSQLTECLVAVGRQTLRPHRIYVVDGASTDGTHDLLPGLAASSPVPLEAILLARNYGGAGGFKAGMQAAVAGGHDWLWLMDDDVVPRPDALERLLAAEARFPRDQAPQLLSSRVEWTDGRLHPLNLVYTANRDKEFLSLAARNATLAIRSASFVSLLVARAAVERVGLPLAAYFLWMDDVEWTARALSRARGVMVPDSVAVHCTPAPAPSGMTTPQRMRLLVRNSLWMFLHSDCFAPSERAWRFLVMAYVVLGWWLRRCWQPSATLALLRGGLRGLLPLAHEPTLERAREAAAPSAPTPSASA